ncbi:MAG: hypothetical protein HY207_03085 [Nitrospirae bacterium]|nr:hypothetical protein [Nitrospirota bacterium]
MTSRARVPESSVKIVAFITVWAVSFMAGDILLPRVDLDRHTLIRSEVVGGHLHGKAGLTDLYSWPIL